MNIRRFEKQDIDEFRRLHHAFENFIQALLAPEIMKFEELSKNGIDEWIKQELDPKRCVFVAEVTTGKLAGFISGEIDEDPSCKIHRWGEVLAIYVDKPHRKEGVAKDFFTALEKWFKEQGCQAVRVETWLNNKRAINAYKAMGFIEFYTGFVKDI